MNIKIWAVASVIALLMCGLLFSFTNVNEKELIKSDFIENLTPDVIDENLDYDIYELIDYQTGKKVNLSIYKDKILLLNFFEPWCPACNKEFFTLNEFAKKYKGKVEVISVSSGEDMEVLNDWQSKWKYKNIRFYIDKTNKLTQYFKIRSIPATFIVNKNGTVNYRFIGDRNYLSLSLASYIDLLLSN